MREHERFALDLHSLKKKKTAYDKDQSLSIQYANFDNIIA